MAPVAVSDLPDAEWVFGYGSLMWNPGFPFVEQKPATLAGYHRAFCIFSHHHRGTWDTPGLVLGLDKGGRCPGVAYRVAPENWAATVAYLNERELVGGYPYTPMVVEVTTATEPIAAFTYVADPENPNYAGTRSPEETVQIINAATGIGGRNRDYLVELVRKMEALGFQDPDLHRLLTLVEATDGN